MRRGNNVRGSHAWVLQLVLRTLLAACFGLVQNLILHGPPEKIYNLVWLHSVVRRFILSIYWPVADKMLCVILHTAVRLDIFLSLATQNQAQK